MLPNLSYTSPANKLNFSTIFFPAVSLFVFVFEIFTVMVVNVLILTSSINSSLLKLPCSTPAMFTNEQLLCWSVESWAGIQNIMGCVLITELWFPWLQDRNWSQTIAEDRTWFADDRRSVFLYDRRTFCNPRLSAITWKPAFKLVFW